MTDPTLTYTDHQYTHQIPLIPDRSPITVGRAADADLSLRTDPDISRLHATLERIGDYWTVIDESLSRNGTFVNGKRIRGRHTLHPGDIIRIGATTLTYHGEPATDCGITNIGDTPDGPLDLTPAQHAVLTELCRPFHHGTDHPIPASNQHIADALHLSTETVKTHLQALYTKFQLDDLPRNQKRSRLVARALTNNPTPAHPRTPASIKAAPRDLHG
ncbi:MULTISPECIES: FHA domain-containing protein [Rhodococcus]|uniref:FHA domain-containing protein n=1 Tax=Rhodococcus oxybenzonivorans TaxID=1990687 RepID=A0AAE5A553_9NOCA|nr:MULTISPECIES: FHA domain-containing protein [Rhodococcus]MDV7243690.1 FHA domain-containing protein [Rhodococcus oxybenzonivorans]MDV7264247.1 FHA domain-containing protein [Rhodococcus oxybenzonivorans]MDV7275068.1 FHA domain-containing protein [Rhodococcus oxybenzonivorans]MDV7335306.1 FHA domain-containing protein [Rhodococcus oxybenzonivorans]MDV7346017.1 FHA domain-containing protein [Rhodococcus oxybenzonivorans]